MSLLHTWDLQISRNALALDLPVFVRNREHGHQIVALNQVYVLASFTTLNMCLINFTLSGLLIETFSINFVVI